MKERLLFLLFLTRSLCSEPLFAVVGASAPIAAGRALVKATFMGQDKLYLIN